MTPTDLLAKLEVAECGNDVLDDAIAELRGWEIVGRGPMLWRDPDGRYVGMERPPLTRSVDAALSLVPEGWGWQARVNNDGGKVASVILLASVDACGGDVYEVAATPALALCIASLRARALMGGGK